MLQRSAINSSTVLDVPPLVQEVLRSPGVPLDANTRAFMEPRFGHDFSQVPVGSRGNLVLGLPGDKYEREADAATDRIINAHTNPLATHHDFTWVRVHADKKAADSARAVNAIAYTVGSDIVFADGQYAPATTVGQRLLAHELAHVIQQSAGGTQKVQRQIKIPVFDELDLCVIEPQSGQKICGSHAKAVCENIPSLPGCNFVCKKLGCKKPEKPAVSCPPGFRPAKSAALKGQCCVEKLIERPDGTKEDMTIESASNCCPPTRAAFGRCCPPDTVVSNGECIKSEPISLCPPGEKVDKQGRPCLPQPVVPDTGSPNPAHFMPMTLYFFYDSTVYRPESNESFQLLASILQQFPTVHVQLTGHSSQEGTSANNLQLSRQRVEAVRAALVRERINGSRLHTFAAGEAIPAVPEPQRSELSQELEDIRNKNRRVEVVFYDPTGTYGPQVPELQLRTPSLEPPFSSRTSRPGFHL
jgi:outer membrane protein OmpA-like peptidoglycan-associated protein